MNKKELSKELKELGIKRGAAVMLHSSYLSLGPVDGGPEAVIDAFLDALGPKGTLMVPAFGSLGVLAEVVKKRPGAIFSPCPKGTVAALGAKADELTRDHWKAESAHGKDTPFTRLADLDGYICLLGVDQDRNTTLHSIEALLELPYLSDTTATFTTPEGKSVTKTWKYYPGPHRDFIGVERYLRHEGLIKIATIGNAQVRLMKASDLYDVCLELGEHDPAFVLCDNPACADCVSQRAAILADSIAHEAFNLTVSSRLAGRYVPEMIENMKAAGVKFVELDYVQGQACAKMSAERLRKIVQEFSESDIEVSGLRVYYIPAAPENIIKLAKDAAIGRVVFPLSENSGDAVTASSVCDVRVSLANIGQESSLAAASLKKVKNDNYDCGFTFNPPAFVKAGEHPFLGSYRIGRFIKTIDQLDMSDALWDGGATRLARGNGEVKELLSILRCHNFRGWVCLGGGAAFPGTLTEAVNDFFHLLDCM